MNRFIEFLMWVAAASVITFAMVAAAIFGVLAGLKFAAWVFGVAL